MSYKVGVIGGMGPLATVKYYEKVVLSEKASKDSDHLNMVILNHASMPDRSEAILTKKYDKILSEFQKDIKILENIGVNKITIPCNTSHFFYDEIQKMSSIKVINMVEETVLKVKNKGYKKMVVFATLGTYEAKIYEKYATKHKLEVKEVSGDDQEKVMTIIYKIKENQQLNSSSFEKILDKYLASDTLGIIACTELSCFDLTKYKDKIIDALDVLVEFTIN